MICSATFLLHFPTSLASTDCGGAVSTSTNKRDTVVRISRIRLSLPCGSSAARGDYPTGSIKIWTGARLMSSKPSRPVAKINTVGASGISSRNCAASVNDPASAPSDAFQGPCHGIGNRRLRAGERRHGKPVAQARINFARVFNRCNPSHDNLSCADTQLGDGQLRLFRCRRARSATQLQLF
jgi:hypothetical protein